MIDEPRLVTTPSARWKLLIASSSTSGSPNLQQTGAHDAKIQSYARHSASFGRGSRRWITTVRNNWRCSTAVWVMTREPCSRDEHSSWWGGS